MQNSFRHPPYTNTTKGRVKLSKKKILITYNEMMVGGSTTSLLAFLNCIDKSKYDVDLQLYRNRGALFQDIPKNVSILPPAAKYDTKLGKLRKAAMFLFSGTLLRARREKKKRGMKGISYQVFSEYQAKKFSRKALKRYDVAIGFMEGWPDKYVAFMVEANKKIGWLHNTFEKLASIPELELPWMRKVDVLPFVADNCTDEFKKQMPEMANKAVTILNILDSTVVRQRAEKEDLTDGDYLRFKNAECFKIVTVCRISIDSKGLDRAVWCAKKLKDAGIKFLWCVVGGGDKLDSFRQMIKENDVEDYMVAVGNRMNPLPFVKVADLYCLLSRFEGKPMAVTETMMIGTPPFVAEYLSAHEQIQDGIDGFVVENEDDSAFEPLLSLLQDPERLKKAKGYLLSHEYGNTEYMREIEEKYL